MVIDLNDAYRMMMTVMIRRMMVMMMETQKGRVMGILVLQFVVPKNVLPNKNVLYILSTCKTIHLADKIIDGTLKMSYPDILVQNCIVFLANKFVIILHLKLSGRLILEIM